jgi:hypothetical protein
MKRAGWVIFGIILFGAVIVGVSIAASNIRGSVALTPTVTVTPITLPPEPDGSGGERPTATESPTATSTPEPSATPTATETLEPSPTETVYLWPTITRTPTIVKLTVPLECGFRDFIDVDSNGWYSPAGGDYFVGETYGTEACAPGAGRPGDDAPVEPGAGDDPQE